MASDAVIDAIAAIPGVIAAVVLTTVSLRAVSPKYPSLLALFIGMAGGGALALLVEHAILGWK